MYFLMLCVYIFVLEFIAGVAVNIRIRYRISVISWEEKKNRGKMVSCSFVKFKIPVGEQHQ